MSRLDHFGLIAPFYDRIFAGFDPARLIDLLALPADRLLDVGGGTGRVTDALANLATRAVIADVSRGMLSAARGKPRLSPSLASAERLPFADGSFDRVLVVDALHHFADQRRAAQELVRVLAPGGRLVVEEMNYERLPVKLVALGEKLLLIGSRFYRPAPLGRLFQGRDLRVTIHADDPLSVWVLVEKANGEAP
jgi:demethylmenaquinone methyltransferase/2-methoxy-6-polyprenyl-1,4-benzoquinol methylase